MNNRRPALQRQKDELPVDLIDPQGSKSIQGAALKPCSKSSSQLRPDTYNAHSHKSPALDSGMLLLALYLPSGASVALDIPEIAVDGL